MVTRVLEGTEEARILVVDDDPVNRKLVVMGLRAAGWNHVSEVADGLAARDWLLHHAPDVVVTDVMMPGMDGLALIRWANKHDRQPAWIILSGLDTFDAAVEAIHLGAFDYLAKPPDVRKLGVSVTNALRHRRLLAEKEKLHRDRERRLRQLERVCRILGDQADQINQDLGRARVIQNALLPQQAPQLPGFSIHSLYRPGRRVGGDLYDVVRIGEQHVAIYVADASGHGVSAAMLSVLFKERLAIARGNGGAIPPGEVLASVNRKLFDEVAAPGMFVTAAYCLLDARTGALRVASAGHPAIELLRAGGDACPTERTGPALGLYPDPSFEERQLRFRPGDRLFLYTDGLIDSSGSAPWRERLYDELRDADRSPLDRLRGLLGEARHSEDGDQDDVTMVLIEARDGPSAVDNGSARDGDRVEGPPARRTGSLVYGESDGWTCICVSGRGTYMQSESFYDAACAVVDARRDVTLDLSDCAYLDSTFLGIIHEVVDRAESAGVDLRIQNVQPDVRALFEELSMELVIRHIGDASRPLPTDLRTLSRPESDPRIRTDILRAHEVLASLSEENRERFRDVVNSLRAELHQP